VKRVMEVSTFLELHCIRIVSWHHDDGEQSGVQGAWMGTNNGDSLFYQGRRCYTIHQARTCLQTSRFARSAAYRDILFEK
jgi:hypothetical protein